MASFLFNKLYYVTFAFILLCITRETEIRRNPHGSSNWDSHVTKHSVYKYTFCQSVVSTENYNWIKI